MLSRFPSRCLAFSFLVLTLSLSSTVPAQAQKAGGQVTLASAFTPPAVRISLELKETPVREALQQVFEKANVRYKVTDNVTGTVTLTATELPYEQALILILRSNTESLGYSLQNGLYTIFGLNGNYDPYAGVGQDFVFTPIILDGRKHVWASGPYPVQTLLQNICRQAKLPFVIGSGVQGSISLSLADVPVEKAIDMICRAAAPAVSHRAEAGIHLFETPSTSTDIASQVRLWIINEEANLTAMLARSYSNSEYQEANARLKSLKASLAKLEGNTEDKPAATP